MTMAIATQNTMTKCQTICVQIANEMGIAPSTVRTMLSPASQNKYKRDKVEAVESRAKELGYYDKASKSHDKSDHLYCNGNFKTHNEEVARMKEMRAHGYSNAEIAKRIGRAVLTVRRNIGAQPKDMTEMNRVLGQKKRAQRNAERREYLIRHEINEHNANVDKLNQMAEQMTDCMAQLSSLQVSHLHLQEKVFAAEEAMKKKAASVGMDVHEITAIAVPNVAESAYVQ